MTVLDWIVLGVYFAVMAAIGLACMRLIKGQEDYFMGSRKFGRLLQTFAAFGAGTGAHEPVTVGRTSWTSGLSGIWSALMWLFVTPVYWITGVWYRRMRHLTLGDWFVERYESRSMGAAYAVYAIVFYVFYLSTMFSAISKFAAPLIGVDALALPGFAQPVGLEYVLVPLIAVFVVFYGALGGLKAAYWTDLIQGLCIILLSIILIPYGLWALVEKFGDPATMSMIDGFTIMHRRISEEYFMLFGGPAAGEFPPHYILALTSVVLVGIVVQPHFIATGGGSARTETSARVGLVSGNFLKRLCTVGWGLTGLIALALLADSLVLAEDPDQVWGVAAKAILSPIGLGLVGLMLACLLAAMMSSADAYMIVTSACVVRNIYAAYVDPDASERTYVNLGRVTGLLVIGGATLVSLYFMDVFEQFVLALEIPLIFAAPFWVGMWWRRAGRWAAWGTMAFTLLAFFIAPVVIPWAAPGLRSDPAYTAATTIIETTATRPATQVDVAQRQASIAIWNQRREEARALPDPQRSEAALEALGPGPDPIELDPRIEKTTTPGGEAILWCDGLAPAGGGEQTYEVIEQRREGETTIVIKRYAGEMVGQGTFNIALLAYQALGVDLRDMPRTMLETLRLPPRLILPFLVAILLGWLTPANSKQSLDRYYAKMKTPVQPDEEADRAALEEVYQRPDLAPRRKLLPGTNIEIQRPTVVDVVGFIVAVAICAAIIALTQWLAQIGA